MGVVERRCHTHTSWYEWARPRFDEDEDEDVPDHNVDEVISDANGV